MKQLTSLAFTCLEMSQLVVDIAVPILNDRVGVGAWESWGVLSEMSPGWSMYPFWKGITSNPQAVTLDSYKVSSYLDILALPNAMLDHDNYADWSSRVLLGSEHVLLT